MTDRAARRDAFLALARQRRVLMGIVNVTPDSFSDGGRFETRDAAVAQARRLVADGADIVDVGAESSRPGYVPITAEEEWRRLDDVLPAVVAAVDTPVSIDTMKATTAARALAAGVGIVNDIWGLQGDPDMAGAVAVGGGGIVVMHNRHSHDASIDIVADMQRFFERSLDISRRAGIPDTHVMLDPGIGFGKTKAQNFEALAAVPKLRHFGCPILVGVSRKSLFGHLLGVGTDDRLVPTLAANLATATMGATIFRVHDIREHRMALTVLDALGV